MAGGKTRALDLQRRLEFFDDNPCPVRTLVVLCQDGPEGVKATSKVHHDRAVKLGWDVRVVRFEPKHVHALFALDKWRQAIAPDLDQYGYEAAEVYRDVLRKVADQLLQ